MFKNSKTAFKAGLISYLLVTLVVVVLLLPYLASLANFEHHHKSNTAKHAHSLEFFVQTDLAAESFLLLARFGFICFLLISFAATIQNKNNQQKQSRAPPARFL